MESAAAQSTSVPSLQDMMTDASPITEENLGAELKGVAKDLDAKESRVVEEVLHEASGVLHEEKEDLADLKEQVQEHKEVLLCMWHSTVVSIGNSAL